MSDQKNVNKVNIIGIKISPARTPSELHTDVNNK